MSAECLNLTATVHSLLEADVNVLMQNILALCSVQYWFNDSLNRHKNDVSLNQQIKFIFYFIDRFFIVMIFF